MDAISTMQGGGRDYELLVQRSHDGTARDSDMDRKNPTMVHEQALRRGSNAPS